MTQRRYHIPEGVYFITTNTADRIPWFTSNTACQIVMEHIWLNASVKNFTVFSFVVMPDHVHMLMQTHEHDISECMRSFKTNSSREINRFLQRNERRSAFRSAGVDTRAAQITEEFRWQPRFHDRVIRNIKDFQTHLDYIIQNPMRAGLVERPEDYLYLYTAPPEVFKDIF